MREPRGGFSPAGSGHPVIYRPEPSPSLTPLLRNYTQSVANKSKKVLAAFVPIHARDHRILPRRLATSPRHLASPLPSRVSRESRHFVYILPPSPRFFSHAAERANLRNQFDRDSGPDSARSRTRLRASVSRTREIRAPGHGSHPFGPQHRYLPLSRVLYGESK